MSDPADPETRRSARRRQVAMLACLLITVPASGPGSHEAGPAEAGASIDYLSPPLPIPVWDFFCDVPTHLPTGSAENR